MNAEIPPAAPAAISRLMEDDPFLARVYEIQQSIVRRAYELYKESEFNSRQDLEEWHRVVSELLLEVPLTVSETDEEISVLAELPGFTEQDFEVKVDTNRVLIAGCLDLPTLCENEKDETICEVLGSREFVREYLLPVPVDPEAASAELKDGVLEIRLAKCADSAKKPAESVTMMAASSAA
ncbi:MAG: Hsp20/alpha crystallin family protein [Candidatus Korobacteraceae bacterium]